MTERSAVPSPSRIYRISFSRGSSFSRSSFSRGSSFSRSSFSRGSSFSGGSSFSRSSFSRGRRFRGIFGPRSSVFTFKSLSPRGHVISSINQAQTKGSLTKKSYFQPITTTGKVFCMVHVGAEK